MGGDRAGATAGAKSDLRQELGLGQELQHCYNCYQRQLGLELHLVPQLALGALALIALRLLGLLGRCSPGPLSLLPVLLLLRLGLPGLN